MAVHVIHPRLFALFGLLGVLFCLGAESSAQADAQVSARLGVGGGVAAPPLGDVFGVFEMRLASELLFGPAQSNAFRIGPALDLRTANFESLEAAVGLTALLPVMSEMPLWVTLGGGYAARQFGDDHAFGLATVAWGLRSYNYHYPYGYGVGVYLSTRFDLMAPQQFEVTAGVEIDLALLLVLPTMAIITWMGGGDPDEP